MLDTTRPQHACTTCNKLAVFDLDGTIIDTQSGACFARYLYQHRLLSLLDSLRLVWWAFCYVFHVPTNQAKARSILFNRLVGMSQQDVAQLMHDFHEQVLAHHYLPQALQEISKRQQEGCTILVVSATFYSIAQQVCDNLGLDGVIATRMVYDANNCVTNQVDGVVIEGDEKVLGVKRWIAQHVVSAQGARVQGAAKQGTDGLAACEPSLSCLPVPLYAYGDHHSDKHLLRFAQHACAVNPDRSLRAIARHEGWDIVEWTK